MRLYSEVKAVAEHIKVTRKLNIERKLKVKAVAEHIQVTRKLDIEGKLKVKASS
jgi:hypothetical protein